MRLVADFTFKQADVFRTISESTRRQLENRATGRPIVQFPAWTDMDAFLAVGADRDVRNQDILYTGVLIPRKGVHHLIDAFATIAGDFPQARLLLVGHEENKTYAGELKEQVRRLGLNGRVQFIDAMPQIELAIWMRRASVFVLPSVSEGLGRVVFEAMAIGTPVIGTRVGGIPDMIEDGVNGLLVPPGDPVSLGQKIRWLLDHPWEAQAIGQRAHTAAEQIFSTNSYIGGYRELFTLAQGLVIDRSEHAPSAV
jgi:glycosyltransferase involved in cell wall biosynthesis